jgi:hypothetical protein
VLSQEIGDGPAAGVGVGLVDDGEPELTGIEDDQVEVDGFGGGNHADLVVTGGGVEGFRRGGSLGAPGG